MIEKEKNRKPNKDVIRYEISPDIVGIAVKDNGVGWSLVPPPNIWIVNNPAGVTVVDTGWGDPEEITAVVKALKNYGAPFKKVEFITTHGDIDHVGGMIDLMDATSGTVLNKTENDFEIIKTPGHTEDSICLLHKKSKTLFTGDTILGTGKNGSIDTVTVNEKLMNFYMISLRKLQRLDVSIIAPGHGVFETHPRVKIQKMIEHRQEREKKVLGLYIKGFRNSDQIAEELYPPNLVRLGSKQVKAHLYNLKQRHLI